MKIQHFNKILLQVDCSRFFRLKLKYINILFFLFFLLTTLVLKYSLNNLQVTEMRF